MKTSELFIQNLQHLSIIIKPCKCIPLIIRKETKGNFQIHDKNGELIDIDNERMSPMTIIDADVASDDVLMII